jgi:hypothetical protein
MALSRMIVNCRQLAFRLMSSKKDHAGKIAAECPRKKREKNSPIKKNFRILKYETSIRTPAPACASEAPPAGRVPPGYEDASQVALVLCQLLERLEPIRRPEQPRKCRAKLPT